MNSTPNVLSSEGSVTPGSGTGDSIRERGDSVTGSFEDILVQSSGRTLLKGYKGSNALVLYRCSRSEAQSLTKRDRSCATRGRKWHDF